MPARCSADSGFAALRRVDFAPLHLRYSFDALSLRHEYRKPLGHPQRSAHADSARNQYRRIVGTGRPWRAPSRSRVQRPDRSAQPARRASPARRRPRRDRPGHRRRLRVVARFGAKKTEQRGRLHATKAGRTGVRQYHLTHGFDYARRVSPRTAFRPRAAGGQRQCPRHWAWRRQRRS